MMNKTRRYNQNRNALALFFNEIITVVQWLSLVISMSKEDEGKHFIYVCAKKIMIIKAFK